MVILEAIKRKILADHQLACDMDPPCPVKVPIARYMLQHGSISIILANIVLKGVNQGLMIIDVASVSPLIITLA